ncbi:MAG: cation:proton antiporter [Candidatus Brocadiaceae bacterium]|nr:cation:proton antiporter [Candidatus Brocadiaceae bacterium]
MHGTDSFSLIIDIVIIIFASFLFGIFAHKLKQSVILAYIVVGILIGPYGFALVSRIGDVQALAEIGVALMMFIIGIEFKFSKIGPIWKVIIFGGVFQIVSMIPAGYLLSRFMGYTMMDSILLGMIGAISSTMIVVKILTEKGELENLHSRIMIGLLIVQDLAVVIMVCFIINFQGLSEGNYLDFAKVLGVSALSVTTILFIGRKLLPKVMYLIVKMESKEMFLLSIFSFAVGISVTTHLLGLSISLGAFIVGFLLSEAEYNLEISALIRPLKDIFIVIFFVSVGLFINPLILMDNIFLVVSLALLIMFGKFICCSLPTWIFGYDGKTAFKVGMGMMQIGEFSFVMLSIGQKHGYLSPEIFSATIAAALISIMLTPLAIGQADRLYYFFTKIIPAGKLFGRIPQYTLAKNIEETGISGHVILCGFGRSGTKVAKGLCDKFDIIVIENDIHKIGMLKKGPYKYLYGDALNHHLLIKARVMTAKILILAIPDSHTKKIATRYAKVYNPEIMVIARAKDEKEKVELQQIGVDYSIVPESLEAIEIIGKVMA